MKKYEVKFKDIFEKKYLVEAESKFDAVNKGMEKYLMNRRFLTKMISVRQKFLLMNLSQTLMIISSIQSTKHSITIFETH